MSTLTFDTYEAIKLLISKGFSQDQAEGFTQVVRQAQEAHLEELATKRDLLELKADLKSDISDVKTEVTEVRGDLKLVKWMLAIVIAAQVLPLLKLFFG